MDSLKNLVLIFLCCLFFTTNGSSQQTIFATIDHDNLEREFIIYIPQIYSPNTPTPLLFCFHGFGGEAKSMMEWADMRPIADTANFILVYPQGSLLDGSSHWNIEGPGSKSDADDFGFTEAMLDTITAQYNINQKRIYACGFSNGGFFSFDLACRMNDRFAAVGCVAGTMLEESYLDCNPSHPTSIITIHGTDDGVVPYNGLNPYYFSQQQIVDLWVDRNQANPTPVIEPLPDLNPSDGSTVELNKYQDGKACTEIHHYKVIGGDHNWPDKNGSPNKINVDITSHELIWNFVSAYNIDGLIGCISSSTEQIPVVSKLKLFPNPAQDYIEIQNLEKTSLFEIYSTESKLIQVGKVSPSSKIDISTLPSNIYFLQIGEQSFRFIKTP